MPVMFSRGDKLEHGHYTIIKEIGVGGMGVVYHCRDEQLLRDVAIKMLLPELMADKANLEVFRQEARLAAQLEHPSIVTVYDIGVEERQKKIHHYVCMEYLPGGNLANRVISGPLAVEHCLNWMKQLASGLTYAHKRGVVHQDIKADNIFITNEGDLKIGDFGLARLLVGRVHYNAQTKGMGTPAYMSPELCRGEPQDHRSDIYSLGVLFFEMATGQLPFRARGMIEMATKHSSAPIPSAKRINPLIPEILDKVIRRMMAKTPEERYSSMSEVLTILDDLIFELRVARLGLGNRPLLRSGNVQGELMGAAPAHPVGEPADGWKANDAGSRAAPYKPDTEPHTTSLQRPNPASLQQLAGGAKQPLSASEQLIAQLEGKPATGDAAHKTRPLEPGSSTPASPPPQTPPRTIGLGHFIQTQQVHQGGTQQPAEAAAPQKPETVNQFAEQMSGPVDIPPAALGANPKTPARSTPSVEETSATLKPLSLPTSSSAAQAPEKDAAAAPPAKTPAAGRAPDAVSEAALRETGKVDPAAAAAASAAAAQPPAAKEATPVRAEPPLTPAASFIESRPTPPKASPPPPQPVATPVKKPPPTPAKTARTSATNLPKPRFGPLLQTIKTGLELQWVFRSKGPIGWSSSPVLDKEERSLYVGSTDGQIYALDAGTGAVKWACKLDSPVLASPVLAGDKVIAVCSSGLVCGISVRDGAIAWRFDGQETMVATPLLVKDMLIAPTAKGRLLAVDTGGGAQRWQYKADSAIVSAPQKHAGTVLFGTRSGVLYAVSSDNGKGVWRFKAGSPIVAPPAVSVDSAYFGTASGTFYAVEAESGGLIWEYPTERPIVAKAVIAFTSVMFCSHDKWMYCCERYDGSLKWKGSVRGKVVAGMVATKDTVIGVTREGWIHAFATVNGELRWQRDLGRSLESQPVVSADRFYVSTVEGEVIAYALANASVLGTKSA